MINLVTTLRTPLEGVLSLRPNQSEAAITPLEGVLSLRPNE